MNENIPNISVSYYSRYKIKISYFTHHYYPYSKALRLKKYSPLRMKINEAITSKCMSRIVCQMQT